MIKPACPLSASTGPLTLADTREYLKRRNISVANDAEVESYFKSISVLQLIEQVKDDQKKAVRWYIDCGDDDFLYEGNSLVHIAMRKKEIPHEFRIHNGGHSWTYWRNALPTVLTFVSEAFHQY
jgi:S-formylglutathione hydrolase FrmB